MRCLADALPIALLLAACASDVTAPPVDTDADTDSAAAPDTDLDDAFIAGRGCPEDSVLTWQNFGQPFLFDHCVGCHSSVLPEAQRAGATEGVDLETQAFAQAWLDRIYARAGDANETMPPVDSVPEGDRELLGDWLACGAP